MKRIAGLCKVRQPKITAKSYIFDIKIQEKILLFENYNFKIKAGLRGYF